MTVARVDVKFDQKAATQSLLKKFNRVKQNKQMNTEIGTFLVKRIQAETRKGKPYNKNRTFPVLSEFTDDTKKRLEKFNKTHKTYRNGRSNLTFTGQLVDGIKFEIKKGGIIQLFTSGKRKTYRTGAKRSARKTPTNSRNEILVKVLKEIGFVLMLGSAIKKDEKINKRIKNIVLRTLRRALKVSS